MTETPTAGLESLLDGYAYRAWRTADEDAGPVRFALIGLGWWTTDQVLPALEDAALSEATVLVSGSAEKAERIAADWESVERAVTYDEFHAGEAADAYDAIYVCTPNAYHLEYAETAADLGKAVLCEKPMEATVERAARMVEACEDADVPLMVGYRMQTDPLVRHARELIRAGAIGEPVHALGNNSQTLLDIIPNPDQWRLDPDLTGYGTSVMDLGIYPLNTTRFLLDADPVRARAAMDSRHEAFDEVPDERSAFTVTLDDGTLLTATASQNAHGATSLRIVGTDGELLFEPAFHMETALRIRRGDDEVTVEPDQANQMTELFDYFADRLLADADVGADGRHGLLDIEAIRAVHEAAETGSAVDVGR
ncbi:D-xylose 1-dehydrogenase Gfo6 [Salinilacihabitans rarus]|uniref:D-xylose 1-dehydrogenase Gfo6 n=1 Tax=Salinilacihabitans rarus TaxID=2961596 RepID=UPI0020C89DC0|nr:D-xylose 1-dehydrogenase Gfo6 [Salinilacihabitans rarus]